MNVNRCTACDAPIVWTRTQRGERMPVDAAPDAERGNVMLQGQPPKVLAGVLTRGQAAGARAAGQTLYTSHFATCPKAREFRRETRVRDQARARRQAR